MSFCRSYAHLTVEEKDSAELKEALLSLIDALVLKNIRVFESDVCTQIDTKVRNAEELRDR
jgi:hypothetical protein